MLSVRLTFHNGCVQVVVCTTTLLKEAIVLDEVCHRHDIAFIKADICGVFASVFCDFGRKFCVLDVDGGNGTCCTSLQVTYSSEFIV